jgi:hypothetical protein
MWHLLEIIPSIYCLRDRQECKWCYYRLLDRRRLPGDTVLRIPLELARN